MQESDTPCLHDLLSFADSAQALDLKRSDCEACVSGQSHVSHKSKLGFFWALGLGGLIFWVGFIALTNHPDSFTLASLATLIFEGATGLLVWPRIEDRCRHRKHAELNRRKNEATRMASALLAYLELTQDFLLGESGVLGNGMLGRPFESFLQRASNRQMELGMRDEWDARSEMLSAIMHGRELSAQFEAYRRDGTRFIKVAFECAHILEMSAASDNGLASQPSTEFKDRCLLVYGKVRTWHEALCRVADNDQAISEFKLCMGGENFQHVEALVALQKLLDSLPEVPVK